MAQIDPTNPAIRAVTGALRERKIEYSLVGGKTHKLHFTMNGKPRRISIGAGSVGMELKVKVVMRDLERIFAQVDQEIAEAKAAKAEANKPVAKPKPVSTTPANYREIRHGNEGDDLMFWAVAENPPNIDELVDRDGTTMVCVGHGRPFKPCNRVAAKEREIQPEWVAAKQECIAVALRRLTPEEQSWVDGWLDDATNPVSAAA